MELKLCPTCKVEKTIDLYSKNKSRKDGLCRQCKDCFYQSSHKHYYLYKVTKKYDNLKPNHKECTTCNNELPLTEFKPSPNGKFKVTSTCKKCFNIKWNEKQGLTGKNNEYRKQRKKDNPEFKLKNLLRLRINDALKREINGGKVSKTHSSIELLGCNIKHYVNYLESKFLPEINWDNHGEVWEIDHITPCHNFNLQDIKQQKLCFHYTNTQPLFKTTKIAESFGYFNIIGNRDKS